MLKFLQDHFEQREVLKLKDSNDLFKPSKTLSESEDGKPQTLLEYIVSKDDMMIKQRDELIDLLKMIEDEKNESVEKSVERVMDLLKEHLDTGPGLVGCLNYVKEKYPWPEEKICIMTFVSGLALLVGWALYLIDVITDCYFIWDVWRRSQCPGIIFKKFDCIISSFFIIKC